MKVLADFFCPDCEVTHEAWTSNGDVRCPSCDGLMERHITGGNFSLPGHDTGYPTAADKWARRHRQANAHNLKDLGIPV